MEMEILLWKNIAIIEPCQAMGTCEVSETLALAKRTNCSVTWRWRWLWCGWVELGEFHQKESGWDTVIIYVWGYYMIKLWMFFSQKHLRCWGSRLVSLPVCPRYETAGLREQPFNPRICFLGKETLAHRSFNAQKPLRTEAFTQSSFYTERALNREAPAHRGFYKKNSFTQRSL